MSPNEIAEQVVKAGQKSFAPPDIHCIVLRWHYLSGAEDNQRPGVEGAYGTKDQIEFLLSTHRTFVADLVDEVVADCIATIRATEVSGTPEDVRNQLIAAIRKRFEMSAS